jgi:hypothetical protein
MNAAYPDWQTQDEKKRQIIQPQGRLIHRFRQLAGACRSYARLQSVVTLKTGKQPSTFQITHRRGVKTTVDVHDLAADTGRQVRAQERASVTHFFNGHVATQWSLCLVRG